MNDRLPSGVVASALIRRVHDVGGFAAVRAKGDAQGGALMFLILAPDGRMRVLERGVGPSGTSGAIDTTPIDDAAGSVEAHWRKRRARDPDLWVIELDSPEAERFAAETLA
jgi:hypothetical protein